MMHGKIKSSGCRPKGPLQAGKHLQKSAAVGKGSADAPKE